MNKKKFFAIMPQGDTAPIVEEAPTEDIPVKTIVSEEEIAIHQAALDEYQQAIIENRILTEDSVGRDDPSADVSTRSKSVIGEVIEAFGEIGDSFEALGNSFDTFGKTVKTQSEDLGNRMKNSINTIRDEVFNLLDKFTIMSANLASGFNLSTPSFSFGKKKQLPSFQKKKDDIDGDYKYY